MTPEERLRAAIRSHIDATEPDPGGWEQIQRRITMRRSNRARYLVVPAAAAAVAAVLLGVSLLGGDDKETPLAVEPPSTTATSEASTTTVAPTSTTTTTAAVAATPTRHVWPTEPGRGYPSASALARAFATDFLGMRDPVISEFRQNEPSAGEIDLRYNSRTTTRTLLSVLRNESGWVVNDARSTNIDLDSPEGFAVITSPVRMTGRSVTYEGSVLMTLLEDGQSLARGNRIGDGYFTSHGDTKGPFEASLSFRHPKTKAGLLVLWTASMENGATFEATVRRVRFTR